MDYPPTTAEPFLDVRSLSRYLNIKPSTLYAWVAQGRIPALKIHGLVRFRLADIQGWLKSFEKEPPSSVGQASQRGRADVDTIVARAKQLAYNPRHGETRPAPSPKGKEGE
jgi:excisionase family DNA binding protein